MSHNEIECAAYEGDLDEVMSLHKSGDTDAMTYAAARGHLDVVKYLHENRDEDNIIHAIDWATVCGHLDIVKFLKSKYTEFATIRTITGEEYQVEFLNVKKSDYNDYSPLYEAVKNTLNTQRDFKLIDSSGDISKKGGVPVDTVILIYI